MIKHFTSKFHTAWISTCLSICMSLHTLLYHYWCSTVDCRYFFWKSRRAFQLIDI